MRFLLVDHVLLREPQRIVVRKHVSLAEEYLQDHFPGFPVLPGVLMVEAMAQAARTLLADRTDRRLVLGAVRAMKFSWMVRPGEALEVEVSTGDPGPDGSYACRGRGVVRRPAADPAGEGGETVVSGRFTMRPGRRD